MDTLQNVGAIITTLLVLAAFGVWETHALAPILIFLGALFGVAFLWMYGRYVSTFGTECVPNGFKDLDPTVLYERICFYKRDGNEEYHVVFRVCGQKKKYAVKTRRVPSKYFLATLDGGWVSYLNVPPGTGEPRHEGPGKVIDMFKKRNGR